MVLTESNMLSLGTEAPDFTLPNPATHEDQSLSDLRGNMATVVIFMCNHCPYVVHVKDALKSLAEEMSSVDISFIGINSNYVVTHPDDAPELMPAEGYPFPYLYDESQEVARAYSAACTPDIYVFDRNMKLAYRGQFDSSRPGSGDATGEDLKEAILNTVDGKPTPEQRPSSGCNIKWK